jgi:hypothetical protein
MTEVYVRMDSIPATPPGWRGIERYEVWSGIGFIGVDPRYACLLKWCEISYHARPGEKTTVGYHARAKNFP